MPDLARPSPDGAQAGPDLGQNRAARAAVTSMPPRRQEAAPTPPRRPAPPPPGRSAAAAGASPTEVHRRQPRESPRLPPRARVGPSPPPPAPLGTLPGGLRRRRRRGGEKETGLAALGRGDRPSPPTGERSGRNVFFPRSKKHFLLQYNPICVVGRFDPKISRKQHHRVNFMPYCHPWPTGFS